MYALNKRARYDYDILESYEAGIELFGHEVKSVREGHMNLKGAFVTIRSGQLWLKNAYIAPYSKSGALPSYNPERVRRLLVHKRQIRHLSAKLAQKGLTLVPLKVYNSNNRVKLEFALVKGKKKHDKRQSIKERDVKRKLQRTLKQY